MVTNAMRDVKEVRCQAILSSTDTGPEAFKGNNGMRFCWHTFLYKQEENGVKRTGIALHDSCCPLAGLSDTVRPLKALVHGQTQGSLCNSHAKAFMTRVCLSITAAGCLTARPLPAGVRQPLVGATTERRVRSGVGVGDALRGGACLPRAPAGEPRQRAAAHRQLGDGPRARPRRRLRSRHRCASSPATAPVL